VTAPGIAPPPPRPGADPARGGQPSPDTHATGDWRRARAAPPLAAGELHVWCAELSEVGARELGALSPRERRSAERLASPSRRRQRAASRALLRDMLARYLECDPGAIPLDSGPDGKPRLQGATAELRFNVSHADGHALCAVAREHDLGVDVQLVRPRQRLEAVVRRAVGDDALAHLGRLAPAQRERELLRAWVRHEAAVKCLGIGLAAAEPPRAGDGRATATDAGGRLWTADLPALPHVDAVAAVASVMRPAALRCLRWSPRGGA